MRRLVAVACKPPVPVFQLHNLDGAAPLIVAIPLFIASPATGMRKVEKEGPTSAFHHIGVTAFHLVILALSGNLD
jgi:hypothetical protein